MQNSIKLSLISVALLSQVNASEVHSVKDMFTDGKTSGQIRLGYYNSNPDAIGKTQSVTAIGGQLKFESASFNGMSAGVAMYTSQNIDALSGEENDGKFSDYLTSSEKSYTELAEAYLNYSVDNFNIRIGRQLIDTPLADSDDVYMTPNTFEAVVASYALKDLGLTFIGANLQRMQGGDADYLNVTNNSWMDTGDNGTNMLAILYANDAIEVGAWYYDVDKSAKAIYVDATANFEIAKNNVLALSAQYLDESEKDNSAVDGTIAGMMLEVSLDKLTASIAYNTIDVDATKEIFEGFGGGCSYTNMETTTAGTLNTDSDAYLISLSYDIAKLNIFTSYGEFKADYSANGHLTELDAGVSYSFNDETQVSFVYVNVDDKLATDSGADEIKLFANYTF